MYNVKKSSRMTSEPQIKSSKIKDALIELKRKVPEEYFDFIMFRNTEDGHAAIFMIKNTEYFIIFDSNERMFIVRAERDYSAHKKISYENRVAIYFSNEETFQHYIKTLRRAYRVDKATLSEIENSIIFHTMEDGYRNKYLIRWMKGEDAIRVLPKGAVKYICFHLDKL